MLELKSMSAEHLALVPQQPFDFEAGLQFSLVYSAME